MKRPDNGLEALLARARAPEAERDDADGATHDFVAFESEGRASLVAIRHLREVVDDALVVPYPEPVAGHVGVVSLRGEILPVVGRAKGAAQHARQRLVVLEFEAGRPFAVVATGTRMVRLDGEEPRPGAVVKIGARAATVASATRFQPGSEEEDRHGG